MGKQAVWLRAVKKAFSPSKDIDISSSTAGKNEQRKPTEEKKKKKKKRWSFGRSSSKQATPQKAISHEDFSPEAGYKERSSDCIKVSSSQRKVLDGEVEQRQSEHAMAVAVATAAAAAEAAVVAAQAAAEVVRLTSAGRTSFYGDPHVEEWAAIKIQSAFRAYLARRALRALKGVVRLQALIRGHAVRRQANATLRCMQALVRVQARIRAQRACYADNRALQRQMLLRQKHEASFKFKSDGSNQEWDDNLQPPEVIQAKLQSKHVAAMKRERALAYAFSHQSWRGMGNSDSSKLTETEAGKSHWGWSWLERWMYARPWEFHSDKNGTDRFQGRNVEGPTMHVMHKSTNVSDRPRSGALNSFKPIVTGQKVVKQVTPHSPMTPRTAKPPTSNAYTASPCSIQTSNEEVNSFPVAKCTPSLSSVPPRFSSMHGIRGSLHDDESLASFSTVPSYMAITESARAKFRSQSTPKERPRSPENDASLFARKRLSFPMTESILGFSGPLKQHSRPTGPQRSPSLKVHSGPVKSAEQSLKDSSMK